MRRIALSSTLVLVLSPVSLALAKDGAAGTVTFSGEAWPVADAVAIQDGDEIELHFAKVAWDRAEWARDGKFESFDLHSFKDDADSPSLTMDLNAEGAYSGHTFRFGPSSTSGGYDSTFESAISISARSAERIAGTVRFPDTDGYSADVSFDLPIIKEGPLARPGKPLPADGGEPGKRLKATIDATHAGDIDAMTALSNPERRAGIEEAKAAGEIDQMLAMAKLFTPTLTRITGGNVDGDRAVVDFIGNDGTGEVKGMADMVLIDGVWYLEQINTSSGN